MSSDEISESKISKREQRARRRSKFRQCLDQFESYRSISLPNSPKKEIYDLDDEGQSDQEPRVKNRPIEWFESDCSGFEREPMAIANPVLPMAMSRGY